MQTPTTSRRKATAAKASQPTSNASRQVSPILDKTSTASSPAVLLDADAQLGVRVRRKDTTSYTTGACGGSSLNRVFITHPEESHALCKGGTDSCPCSCDCHRGLAPWEGRYELIQDARSGKGAGNAKYKHPANAIRERNRSTGAPETLTQARATKDI